MVRLLGDGGMAFFLKDLVVEPEYQGNGIGKALVIHAENYIRSQLKSGWTGYLQLVSAKGKESFYEKMGFRALGPEQKADGIRFTSMRLDF